MIKRLLSLTLCVFLLALCLFLPDLVAIISDYRIETDPVYTVFCPEEEFSYIGTLPDRLRALTNYENMSVDYTMTNETKWETGVALPEGADALFPDLGEGETRAREITLSHKTVPVRFRYRETELHAPGGSVRTVQDIETGKLLRLSVTGAFHAIENWENTHTYDAEGFLGVTGVDAYALLRAFSKASGFTDITDLTGGNSYGGSVSTVKADVKGEAYTLSVTFSEAAGTIYYRITQADGK